MRNRSLAAVAYFSLLSLIACTSALKINTKHDKKVDFSKYKTFTFYGFADKTSGLSDFNRNKIITSIKAELLSQGFTQDENKPDILVNATAILKEKSQVSNTNYYGYGGVYRPYYWGTGNNEEDLNVRKYNEGSLIIDIIDANTKVLVWQGVGNKEIDIPLKESDTNIPIAVKKIMASFPPGKKK